MKKSKTEEKQVKKVALYTLFFLIGILLGSLFTFLLNPKQKATSKNIIKDSKFEALYETYDAIKEKYYKDVKDETLVNGAINGMMESLDDKHSTFFDKEEKKDFEDELSGSYYGIGAEIKETGEKEVMINKVFDGSPAEKAGLKQGDIFVSIDGKSTEGKTPTEIAKNLRSKKKDSSTIIVKRDGEEVTIKVEKDIVDLYSVSSEMLEDNIGYVSVDIFGERTYSQFVEAINSLESKGMESLIIDLRGNSGGYLSTVTNMISEFVDSKTVIYQMKTRQGTTPYTAVNNKTKNYKIVVLIDNNSASASEIMASAMQEQYHATLVGMTTYGKGTVQEPKDLSNGTLIKYTIQEWLTSKGNSINGKGVKPDVEIELSEDYKNNPVRENDNQLQKAIELLK